MAPKNRIIIDTDPGVDDALAMLLALSASPEELEVVMLCLRNVVALFHVLEKEQAWRSATGRSSNRFGAFQAYKPLVAVGADRPLEDELLMADHFHGADGLHGVHEAHPDLTPSDTWQSLFSDQGSASAPAPAPASSADAPPSFSSFFTPSKAPAHQEILRILRQEPADTITIVAIGPLTNVALAAAEDPEAFLRVKELVVMGGAVHHEGNITPLAEFNCYADAVAAARVFALTSPLPASTMPPALHGKTTLPPYPAKLSRTLPLTLFPLDITTPHLLNKQYFLEQIGAVEQAGSPLARWIKTFMVGTFRKIESIVGEGVEPGLSLHDPLCIWYMLAHEDPAWTTVAEPEDIRIETTGQWTRGMHVVDKRGRPKTAEGFPGDTMAWLTAGQGNRINRIVGSPGEEAFAHYMMGRLFT